MEAMTILFVCTGNTCRSPMAAALMRRALDNRGRSDIIVNSAGLAAQGEPISRHAVAVMTELDASYSQELSAHVSQSVTPAMLQQADHIAVMSRSHAMAAVSCGADPAKVSVLSANNTDGIADPYGGDLAMYRRTRDELEKAVEALADTVCINK